MKKILLIFLCLYVTSLSAQKDPLKWGKVSQAEVDLNVVDFDSSATAVILCDYGRISSSIYDGASFRRHIRIKILTDRAKDLADIVIPYYHTSEKIAHYSAQTINIENNKPKKIELSKKDFFRVKKNENWSELKFTFPEVKAGSIIEYSYTTESESFGNLDPWHFQNSIPTLRSYLEVLFGGDLNYNIMYQGKQLINKYRGKSVNIWELKNLPAIKAEPFCPNYFDYVEKLNFQLAGYRASTGYQRVMGNWKDVTADIYSLGGVKQYLKKNKDANNIVKDIISEGDDEKTKIQKIYDYIISKYQWNKYYSMLPKENYKDFKVNNGGNSAEMNLFFINLLQSAGMEATPALLSTKKNGIIAQNIPFYKQFNQLVAHIKLNEKDLLIDATNPYRPYDLLAEADLSTSALVLNRKEPFWVKIVPNKKTKSVKLVTMEIPEPGTIKYKYELNAKGYDAMDIREELKGSEANAKKYFKEDLLKENTSATIENVVARDLENKDKAVYLSAEIEDNSSSIVNDDFIYINPFVDPYLESNPFNAKERYFPIDFYYPFEEMYILNFKAPEGYEIIEYPESINVMTEGNKGFFKINSSLKEDTLQMRVSFAIKDPFFIALEYPLLREIFDRYIEKRAEQIVLKKKA